MLTQDFPLHRFLRNYAIAALTVGLVSFGLSQVYRTGLNRADRLGNLAFSRVVYATELYTTNHR